MKAAETFSWPERPLVALHGHALAEKDSRKRYEGCSETGEGDTVNSSALVLRHSGLHSNSQG